MADERHGKDVHHFKMKPKPGAPAGLETDGHGQAIPVKDRTPEDQAAALRSSKDRGPG